MHYDNPDGVIQVGIVKPINKFPYINIAAKFLLKKYRSIYNLE